MLKNEKIVCISYSTWEGPYTKSVVQLTSILSEQNKILFVEYPFTFKDIFTTLIGKQKAPVARMLGFKDRLVVKKTQSGSEVFTWVVPPVLPISFIRVEIIYQLLFSVNTLIYRLSVRKALKKLKMERPISLTAYNPIYGKAMIRKFNEKANIYYCYDGFTTNRLGKRILDIDENFSRRVDGIIVSSDFLKEQKLQFNKKVITVKNGVDFPLFNQSAKNKTYETRTRKIVGYIGSIDERFDIETYEYAVKKLPEYDFEIIGDLRNKNVMATLSKYPNVRILPPIDSSKVPLVLKNYDVAVIPYIANEFTKNVYPLKINEYLAVGVPVVATAFAKLPDFDGFASFVDTKEAFIKAIVREIVEDSQTNISRRIVFAEQNSWRKRAELFADAIFNFIS